MKTCYFTIPKMKTKMLIDDIIQTVYLKTNLLDDSINGYWIISFDNVKDINLQYRNLKEN